MSIVNKQDVLQQVTGAKRMSSLKVAQARAGVEAALENLRLALREDAQVRVSETVDLVKRGLVDGEGAIEGLIARVPGLGPWLAMEMFRVTHAEASEEELPLLPTNREERSTNDAHSMLAYLDCIGCHMA